MPAHVITAADYRQSCLSDLSGMVIGVDEAGRGAWAGPIVVGALELRCSDYAWSAQLRDSKKLNRNQRHDLSAKIALSHAPFEIGSCDNNIIDEYGIDVATVKAASWALLRLWRPSSRIRPVIFDGTPSNFPGIDKFMAQYFDHWYFLPKADAIVPAVSGASILAKVDHDVQMIEAAEFYPRFGWEENVGYGTKAHRKALMEYGSSGLHRYSYMPMKALFNG